MSAAAGTLREKARWVRRETLRLHRLAPETRLASALSPVEILVALFYGGLLRFRADDRWWEGRDRLIVSKGHGVISLYPILADVGYFPPAELDRIGVEGGVIGVMPDAAVPGFETTNGSLGHGIGVGCGIALALRARGSDRAVFVLCGDGELNAGAMWEATMFASFHGLDNLTLIVDDNKKSMLGHQADILGLAPLDEKFQTFGWRAARVDGHDAGAVHAAIAALKEERSGRPKVLIADTVKGKGVPELESNPICHVLSLKPERIDAILEDPEWPATA